MSTANPSHEGALLYADEASFGEVSTTFDERLPIVGSINDLITGLEQTSADVGRTAQYQNDGHNSVRLTQGGTIKVKLAGSGHGSTGAGALSASVLGTFLGRVFGNQVTSQVGGTVAASPTDADTFSLSSATIPDGGIGRIGSINDGRGNGQFYRFIDAATPGDPIVANALTATPNAGDVVYAAELIHPSEGPTAASLTSMRFQIQTANQRYNCFGCYPTAVRLNGLNANEYVQWEIDFAVSAWAPESSSTFPTTVSTDTFPPVVSAGGSVHVQDVGVTTLQHLNVRDLEVTFNLHNVGLRGPGAPRSYQAIVDARRAMCAAHVKFTIDREAAGTDTWGDWWNTSSTTAQQIMISLGAIDGQSMGIYLPKCVRPPVNSPTQQDRDGLNTYTIEFMAVTGGTLTTELERANFVIALA